MKTNKKHFVLNAALIPVLILVFLYPLSADWRDNTFSAFDGLSLAKDFEDVKSFDDAKLVQIFTFNHTDTIYGPKTIINIDMSTGKATSWFYAFYSEIGNGYITIMVSNSDSGYQISKLSRSVLDPENRFPDYSKDFLIEDLVDSDELPDIPVIDNNSSIQSEIKEFFDTAQFIFLDVRDTTKDIPLSPETEYYWLIVNYDDTCYLDAQNITTFYVSLSEISTYLEFTSLQYDQIIYPNPADELIIVSIPDDYYDGFCRLYNGIGDLIFETTLAGSRLLIDCKDFSPGMYIIKLIGKKEIAYPLIIRH